MEVWPDNWKAVALFQALATQWRVGARGVIGLDYSVLFHKMDRMKLSAEEYEQMEEDIRILEDEALLTFESMREEP